MRRSGTADGNAGVHVGVCVGVSLCVCVCVCLSLSLSLCVYVCVTNYLSPETAPQWGAADAEIKVQSGENTELKRSPFKAWSKSVYSHTCYAYCQGFLSYFYTSGPFTCIFSKTSPDFSLCWLWLLHGSCVGPQNKIGHPAGLSARGI